MAFPSRILPLALAVGLAIPAALAVTHAFGDRDGQETVASLDIPETHHAEDPTGRHPLPRPSPSRPYGVG